MKPLAWAAVLLVAAAPSAAAGQELARRVGERPNGTVRFSFPVRAGVEICSRGIRMRGSRTHWREEGRWGADELCRSGPAEVEVRVADGIVARVEVLRAGQAGSSGTLDLGEVGAAAAADYLIRLARAGATERGARDALFPAVLADVPDVWRDLLSLARDREVRNAVRTNALFWLGQEAADAATEGLAAVARAEDENQDVRDAAVFALSQRPADEGVPLLMELARTAEQAKTRRTAFFWLAQSQDPRVVPFFEEILLGRGGA
ncbi:MAG TPA: HEAT repeat domain-containing protein [Longimicrobiales bacterium]|nr:HEAT repeat domain-containing protein [Longimicrobiales bacterium]